MDKRPISQRSLGWVRSRFILELGLAARDGPGSGRRGQKLSRPEKLIWHNWPIKAVQLWLAEHAQLYSRRSFLWINQRLQRGTLIPEIKPSV